MAADWRQPARGAAGGRSRGSGQAQGGGDEGGGRRKGAHGEQRAGQRGGGGPVRGHPAPEPLAPAAKYVGLLPYGVVMASTRAHFARSLLTRMCEFLLF